MKQKILYILVMITALIGGNTKAWAQETYYVVNDGAEKEVMTSGSGSRTHTYNLSGPGLTLTFEIRDNSGAATGKHWIYLYDESNNQLGEYSYNAGTSWESKTISNIPINTTKVSIKGSGTLKKLVRNVKVTRATTLTSNPTSLSLGNVQLGETRSGTISVSWNNTYSGRKLNISENDETTSLVLDVPDNNNDMEDFGIKEFAYTFTAQKLGNYNANIILNRNDNTTITIPVIANVVGKYMPTFNFSLTSANPNHVYNLTDLFSTDSPNAYTITSNDETKAKIIDNKLYVLAQSGEFNLTVSQTESEQWYAKTVSHKINIIAETETTHSQNIGDFEIYCGIVWETYNKQLSFPFPCHKITYDAEYDPLAYKYFTVKISKDHGSNWTVLDKANRNITEDRQSFTETIEPSTTHIDFIRESGSSLGLNFYNVTFHMASYMTPSKTSVACGRTMVGNTSEVQNITIDWSDVEDYNDNLKVMCDNPNFSVSVVNNPCEPANQTWGTNNQRWGQSTISIIYTPTEEGSHTGNIYFYDNKRFITIPVSGEAYDALILSPNTNPNTQIMDGGVLYSKVQLNRALPKGYFTATFPFDYNISVILNAFVAQLELVTHNQQDGYTLYFKKVADGQMLANQPYVVYLPEAISNPEWADVIIMKPKEGSVSSDKTKGWTMRANYTPEMSMVGNYGIAGGKLCLGTTGSTINAYTAYFIPPTANARVRMAVLDDDGGVTYIDDVREDADAYGDAEQIYRLDGTRHATLTKGINIVKMANGEVRKVLK